jgi:exopolysaccharide biosynthesis polyprenyl glycosylphosphotransferase
MSQLLADTSTSTRSQARVTRARAGVPQWRRSYRLTAITLDTVSVLVAALAAEALRFGGSSPELSLGGVQVSYMIVASVLIPIWLWVIALNGTYDYRAFGSGADEYRKLLTAGAQYFAAVAVLGFVLKLEVARGFVALAIPLAVALSVGGRYLLRARLRKARTQGLSLHRVLLVGRRTPIKDVAEHLARTPEAGFDVVATHAVEPDQPRGARTADEVPSGELACLLDTLETLDIDTLVVTDASVFRSGELKQLSWKLEDLGVSLIVAPAVTDIAGPRISIRPIAGLPLLHVETPRFSIGGRVYKAVFDRCFALLTLLLLAPMLLVVATLVRCTSRGPVLFRQERVGLNGQPFVLWKFRSMMRDAPELQAALVCENGAGSVLFKLRRDPRVTKIGRLLRRFSIDELPQLAHVLSGKMSLVGPRPPLPEEVTRYEDHVGRRLLVKPGMTGLWQVAGRSDLPWDDAVRLDLHYVDNWSPAMDAVVLAKTIDAVFRGRGAY